MPTDLAEPTAPSPACHGAAAHHALAAFHRYLQFAARGAPADVLADAQADLDASLELAGLEEADLVPRYPRYRVFALLAALQARTCE